MYSVFLFAIVVVSFFVSLYRRISRQLRWLLSITFCVFAALMCLFQYRSDEDKKRDMVELKKLSFDLSQNYSKLYDLWLMQKTKLDNVFYTPSDMEFPAAIRQHLIQEGSVWRVIIGSYNTREEARLGMEDARSKGIRNVSYGYVWNKNKVYAVFGGEFSAREKAIAHLQEIKEYYPDAYVLYLRNWRLD